MGIPMMNSLRSRIFSTLRWRYPTWGSESTMTSPETLIRRSHRPWVEGCEGPMLTHISAMGSPPLPGLPVLEVLAQREADPVLGQEHAALVGVPHEVDAEHVVLLALEPVGAAPHEGGRGDLGVEPVGLGAGLDGDRGVVVEEEVLDLDPVDEVEGHDERAVVELLLVAQPLPE